MSDASTKQENTQQEQNPSDENQWKNFGEESENKNKTLGNVLSSLKNTAKEKTDKLPCL